MQAADKPELVIDDEEVRVYRWRRLKFLELGFGRGEAQILAMGGADWHVADRLLASGCSYEIAFDLLS